MEGITVAGLLMFGTDEALREGMPQYHVDYREKLSDNPEIRWTDRLTMDGTWPANLFQFYLRVIQRLSRDLQLPFRLGTDLFRKGETIVHEAIREALVNALIHADYQGSGGIIIEKYPNRFEFSNPGTLLISLEQLLQGNISECRNKTLQTMFMMIGAAEKAGSGVDKIRRGWESQHWRSPLVREQVQPDRVLWVLPMISLIPEESLQRLRQLFGKRFTRFSQVEVQALVTADIEGAVDNGRMRQITGSHASDMTRILQGLVGKKALIQEGRGRWSRYRLPAGHTDNSLHNEDHSVHNGSHSVHNGDHSVHNGSHSVHNGKMDSEIWETLLLIAAPAREKRRLDTSLMEKLILELCRNRWLSRREISELLQRNPDGLRSRFLTPMVEHGLLRLRYPDKPNRTDQAYTAADTEEGEEK